MTMNMTMNMTMYMNMNMCIIMYMNIYISPTNEKRLRDHPGSMSGLVNSLLDKHFSGVVYNEPIKREVTTPTNPTPIKQVLEKEFVLCKHGKPKGFCKVSLCNSI